MPRIRRDNADDFLCLGADALRAWCKLAEVECPPSTEVFEHGYFASEIEKAPVSMSEYAEYLTHRYARKDSGSTVVGEDVKDDRGNVQRRYYHPWYVFSDTLGRLIPR